MILHYIKLTFRKLSKSYVFTVINIGGLVMALACSFLIYLFVYNEMSTDKFHHNRDHIYRIVSSFEGRESGSWTYPSSPFIMSEVIINTYPEIEKTARICNYDHFYGGQYISKNDDWVKASKFIITDQDFFNLFSFKVILGDKDHLINDLYSLVLSERSSQKLFPDENPVGKTLRIKNYQGEQDFVITGVIEDIPSSSSIQADFIGNVELASSFYRPREWNISSTRTFIQFREGTNIESFVERLNTFARETHPKNSQVYSMQSMNDIYFKSDVFSFYDEPQGNYTMITIFSIIGVLILLIASINYIIISTARSTERVIEIGMRKVMGANKGILFGQIITESILISLIAFPIAIILSELALPILNRLLGKEIDLDYITNWPYLVGIFFITLLIGLLSGSYISLFISSFSPDQIFKKRFTKPKTKFDIRKLLITAQIIVFLVLFIFVSVILLQLNYVKNKEIGFETDGVVLIYPPHDHDMFNCKTYVDEIQKFPSVSSVSEVGAGLFTGIFSVNALASEHDPENRSEYNILNADSDYLETLKFNLVDGRLIDKNRASDSNAIIINETAANLVGDNYIGKFLLGEEGERFRVIGIVEDFHFQSLHKTIPPLGIVLKKQNEMISQIAVRIHPENNDQTLDFLEQSWDQYGPYGRFEYEFIGSRIEQQYEKDKNFAETIMIFTLITLFIASLGMFGFSFYNTRQKVKEIGIRKVFGASSKIIVTRILKDLFVLILIANLISWPVAYLISHKWLTNFAYHPSIRLWVFLIAAVCSVLIVLITSGIVALKAANQKPVDSIRYE